MFLANLKLSQCADNRWRADQGFYPTPVAKTADYTLTKADAGKVFSNSGASGTVNFTLPTVAQGAKAGMRYHFTVIAAQTLTVTAPASTKVNNSANAGNISAAGTKANKGFLSLMFNGTHWVVTGVNDIADWTTT